MKLGADPDPRINQQAHIDSVVAEIASGFPDYFSSFKAGSLKNRLAMAVESHQKEEQAYREYLNLDTLEEYESDPGAFKSATRKQCPIIRRCVMSQEDYMRVYQIDFGNARGRDLLDVVKRLATFGRSRVLRFQDVIHESTLTPGELGLEPLNTDEMYLRGVVGFGIQGTLLYGAYPREFPHRSQNSVWALYFLSGRKDFGMADGSEFMMIQEKDGTAEQNYFYPADLFGFYSLKLYLLLRDACSLNGVALDRHNRYIYVSAFCDYVADHHRGDINILKISSEDKESRGWY